MTEKGPQINQIVTYDPEKHISSVEGIPVGYYVTVVGLINGIPEVLPFWEPEARNVAGLGQRQDISGKKPYQGLWTETRRTGGHKKSK